METWKLCGAALLTALVFAFVRRMAKDFELPLRLAAAVVFGGVLLGMARPLFTYLWELSGRTPLGEYAPLLTKALGITVLTGVCADLCRELGEAGVAGYVELAGRLALLLLSLPLMEELLATVGGLIS